MGVSNLNAIFPLSFKKKESKLKGPT